MNAVLLEQTASHLTRQTLRWDRRLRLAASLIWIPRALMVGLLVGVAVALVSRLRPWLLPEQIALAAATALAVAGVGSAALIWLWPRSTTHQARYFDRRFGLKERISTALELAGGAIPVPDHLTERQLTDAVNAARRVDLVHYLPLRVRWAEILAVITLAGLLAYLLTADNPHNDDLRAQRELENAIDSQIANLDETITTIRENPALSDEEKEALTQPLEEARDILQQPNVSQEEAVAALAEASQSLSDLSDGMRPDQEAAYQRAASQLAGSEMTRDMAEALQKSDLGETAEAMDDLADRLGETELSEAEREELAAALESAANELQGSNPALAEKLREAAQALRDGDIEAAQRALREAAEIAREQSEDIETSPMAQAAQQASQETNENQREMAQAGQQPSGQVQPSQREPTREEENPPEGLEPQAQSGQPSASEGEQGDQAEESDFTTGEEGEQGQPGAGQQPGQGQSPSTQTEGQMQEGEGAGEVQGEGEGQSDSSGSTDAGDQAGEGGEGSQFSEGQPSTGAQSQQEGALSAGSGEGGAGTDDVAGTQAEAGQGEISTENDPQDGGIEEFDPVFDPFNIGGESTSTIDIGGDPQGDEGEMVQEGEFGPNPEGVSMLSYTGVFGRYQDIVSDALESGRIPLDQRDVIHDYFSSLER